MHPMKNTPLISVITVTYNAVDVIEKTIHSVINQPYDNFEYIIIDGNSTDGTQALIEERYLDKIDGWLSEPDSGIPDALNKGVKLARGKYIVFILAGDTLIELPHKQLLNEDADLVCFPVRVTGDVVAQPRVNRSLKIMNTIPHQGAFFKRTKNLVHDNRYRFYCDLALCQVYYKQHLFIKTYNSPVVAFHGLDGATSNKNNFKEVFKVVGDNYGPLYRAFSFMYFKIEGIKTRLNLR
jgi:glycosyltransferase involved in cell wall biosynthesis